MKKQNFTLTELLVAISIIAILAGLTMPALNKARSSAMATACASNLKQVGAVFMLYANDYSDLLPPADCDKSEIGTDSTKGNPWYNGLEEKKYFSNVKDMEERTVVNCPMTRGTPKDRNSYGVPVGAAEEGVPIKVSNSETGFTARSRLDMDAKTNFLAADSTQTSPLKSGKESYAIRQKDSAKSKAFEPDSNGKNAIALRHANRVNMVMLDGRVDTCDLNKVKKSFKDTFEYAVTDDSAKDSAEKL